MKKIVAYIFFVIISLDAFSAPVERIYVSTDRSVYLAGEQVFCSLFCLDVSGDPVPSDLSSVAYVELAAEGVSNVTAKISLLEGRGSGYIMLPPTLPTGNYRLYAYTTQNRNESGKGYLSFSKVISVFNTSTTSRVKGGVKILDADKYNSIEQPSAVSSGKASIVVSRAARTSFVIPVTINNVGGKDASVSVSVYHDDGIHEPDSPSIKEFINRLPSPGSVSVTGDLVPEYDGEILYANLVGQDWKSVASDVGLTAFISSSGEIADTYASPVAPDGSMVFYTNNIFGDREMICELCSADTGRKAHISLKSPFINVDPEAVDQLCLSPSLLEPLRFRNLALRQNLSVGLDTLVEFLPSRVSQLISKEDCKVYHLDDYVRFPSMEELCVEIVKELRITGKKDERHFSVLYNDPAGKQYNYLSNVLTLLDGVPMTDQSKLISFDAMLLSDVELYLHPYLLGHRVFSSVVNFVTLRNNITSVRFSDQTRVFDFKGVSYPVALTAKNVPSAENDYRQTLYWHPSVTLEAGKEKRLEIRTPSYPGVFKVVVEGLDSEGTPIYSESSFEVR